MPRPARWKDDPECGHDVACEFQTHYCTYVRAPRLLSLQRSQTEQPAETFVILTLQAFELWFAVLNRDIEAALEELAAEAPPTQEPAKLLRRCSKLIQLLGRQTGMAGAVLLADAGFHIRLRPSGSITQSAQFDRLVTLTGQVNHWAGTAGPMATGLTLDAARDYVGRFIAWKSRYTDFMTQLISNASSRSGAPYYADYLALDELLSLQEGITADWTPKGQMPTAIAAEDHISPDELMFIVVHQAFELWFKAILLEMDEALALLTAPEPQVTEAARHLRRTVNVQKVLVDQIHIPATMLPLDFFKFRSQSKEVNGVTCVRGLSPSSGTESYQFREIEIAAGLKGDEAHREFLDGRPSLPVRFLTPAQEQRLAQPSLPEAFAQLLEQRGVQDVVEIFTASSEPNPHADLADLAEVLLEFDQFFHFWRLNHATMVQVMIGEKSGTGFLGPEYLRETAGLGLQGEGRVFERPQVRPRYFGSLWEARTRLGGSKRS